MWHGADRDNCDSAMRISAGILFSDQTNISIKHNDCAFNGRRKIIMGP